MGLAGSFSGCGVIAIRARSAQEPCRVFLGAAPCWLVATSFVLTTLCAAHSILLFGLTFFAAASA
eukprot:723797-Amphidinium_carterae.1